MYNIQIFDSDAINDLLAKLDFINQQELERAKEIIEKAISIDESKENTYVGTFETTSNRFDVHVYLDRIFLIPVQLRPIKYRVL